MRVLILGAGGVGVYFGGRLAQSGAEVSVVARGDYETASREGYRVSSVKGDFHFRPASVLRSAADYQGEADYVILATKVLPEVDRAELLRPAIRSKRTAIVLIQNGVDIEEPICKAFPENELLSSIAYIGVSRPASGQLLHQGGGMLKMGLYPKGLTEAARRLSEAFAQAGVTCELYEDIRLVRWYKLLWNLPFNSVSVLAGQVTTRQMVDGNGLEGVCAQLMREVLAVANADGVPLPAKAAEENMQYTREFPAYKTSMLQDFEAGRPLEVEAILGNAVRIAERHKIAVPYMNCCYQLLKSVAGSQR